MIQKTATARVLDTLNQYLQSEFESESLGRPGPHQRCHLFQPDIVKSTNLPHQGREHHEAQGGQLDKVRDLAQVANTMNGSARYGLRVRAGPKEYRPKTGTHML